MLACRRLAAVFVPFVLCASLASAAELVMKNHHLIEGEVVSTSWDTVEFKVKGGEGDTTLNVAVSDLEPYSFYVVKAQGISSAADHLTLAKFCLDNALYARARAQYNQAVSMDAGLKGQASAGIAAAREGSAQALITKAKAQAAKGNAGGANATLQGVSRNFGDTQAAAIAAALQESISNQIAGARAAARAQRIEHEVDKHFSRIVRAVDRGNAYNTKGLQADHQDQELNNFTKAQEEFQRALHECEELAKKYKNDAEAMKRITDEEAIVKSDLIDAYMNSGGIYMARTSFQQAMTMANHAIAVDQTSGKAKAFRDRVTTISGLSGW